MIKIVPQIGNPLVQIGTTSTRPLSTGPHENSSPLYFYKESKSIANADTDADADGVVGDNGGMNAVAAAAILKMMMQLP